MCGVDGLGIGALGNARVLHEGESRALFGMDGSGRDPMYIATNGVGSSIGKFNQYL